jgi:Domain of unknown function (DUF4129)
VTAGRCGCNRREAALVGALALLFLLPGSASAQQTTARSAAPLDLAEYEAQLDSYAGQISTIRQQPAELARIRKSLPPDWIVRVGKSNVRVATEWLSDDLALLSANRKHGDELVRSMEARLAAMREAAAQLDAAEPAPKNARARLDAVLARREFSGLHGPTELQILEARLARWVVEQIVKLLTRLHLRTEVGNVVGWIVIGIAFVFLCWWLWDRLATLTPKPESSAAADVAGHASSRAWLDEALAAADRGEYREAVHCAYWAAIARLEDSGRLSRDRARTPRESLRQLRAANSGERETLRELTRSFELVWYGYRPVSAADWIGARAQLENMGCLKVSTAATVNS